MCSDNSIAPHSDFNCNVTSSIKFIINGLLYSNDNVLSKFNFFLVFSFAPFIFINFNKS